MSSVELKIPDAPVLGDAPQLLFYLQGPHQILRVKIEEKFLHTSNRGRGGGKAVASRK